MGRAPARASLLAFGLFAFGIVPGATGAHAQSVQPSTGRRGADAAGAVTGADFGGARVTLGAGPSQALGDMLSGAVPLPGLRVQGPATLGSAPVANPLPTLSSVVVRGTTARADAREFVVNLGLVSNTGAGHSGPNANDKVALYSGVEGQAGTADIWAANFVLNRDRNSGHYSGTALEVDVNDDESDTWNTAHPSRGVSVTSGSTFPIAFAYECGSTAPGNAAHACFYSGGATTADFMAQGRSPDVLLVGGVHDHVVNVTGAASAQPFIMKDDQYVTWIDAGGHTFLFGHRSADDSTVLLRDGVELLGVGSLGQLTAPGVVTGHLGVAAADARDLAVTGHMQQPVYAKAALPACQPGWTGFVSDGRNAGEGPGAGTGVLAYCTRNGAWMANGAPVAN